MKKIKWLWGLQLFADGAAAAGDGAGPAAESGVDSEAEAAAQRLRELGVPEDRIRKRAKKAPKAEDSIVVQRNTEPAPAAEVPAAEEQKQEAPTRMTWEEIMKDPEYNKQMQATIQQRLKGQKEQQEKLTKLDGVMQTLADYYGISPDNIDEIVSKVTGDDRYYEEEADRLGVSADVARKLKQAEQVKAAADRTAAAEAARAAEDERNAALRSHFDGLVKQGEVLKASVPGFDLQAELQNPTFARLTAPGSGLTVEDAYFAVHRAEMMQQGMTQATINAQRQMARSMQANASRPTENGMGNQASSLTQIDYRNMSKTQRQQLKDEIRRAAGRGEKIYPADIFGRR